MFLPLVRKKVIRGVLSLMMKKVVRERVFAPTEEESNDEDSSWP